MAQMELDTDSYVLKFKNLWKSGGNASLSINLMMKKQQKVMTWLVPPPADQTHQQLVQGLTMPNQLQSPCRITPVWPPRITKMWLPSPRAKTICTQGHQSCNTKG